MNNCHLLLLLALAHITGCDQAEPSTPYQPTRYSYSVLQRFPHNTKAFTQGLVIHEGRLFEGTGQRGSSMLREVDITTGQSIREQPLAPSFFGEGITVMQGRIYQLTWEQGRALVYDVDSFAGLPSFTYEGQGWGLTHDDQHLIMSDGSSTLTFRDPDTFSIIRTLVVTDRGRPLDKLNELELIQGYIFANIWQTDRIAMIDPTTGVVVGWIDLAGLLDPSLRDPTTDVLNGIAYDAKEKRLFVTGKNWPLLFEIEVRAMK